MTHGIVPCAVQTWGSYEETQTAHVNIVTACLTNGGYVTQVYTTKEGHVTKGDVLWE